MATFGEFPGVRITTTGGGISAVRIGSADKLLLIGDGDTTNSEAIEGEVWQVSSGAEADNAFGEGSELADAVRDAFGNRANQQFTYGVILPDYDETQAESPDISPLEAVFTVERGDTESDYSFIPDGEYIGITNENAFGVAKDVVNEGETGIYNVLQPDTDELPVLESQVEADRQNYKMVTGFMPATPNDGDDRYDTSTITSGTSSAAMFEFAPVFLESDDPSTEATETIMGGIGGLFAGSAIDQPVYDSPLFGFGNLEQRISRSQASDLRNANIIPIKENGSIRVVDNTSTAADDDIGWETDFWRRRIVDRVILIAKQVGESVIGRINDSRTRRAAEKQIESELRGLVRDRLLESGTSAWRISVEQDESDPDRVNIDLGITPQGIAKRIDVEITIDT